MTLYPTTISQRIIHTSGIDESRGETCPRAYAERLAVYIRDPSTIVIRVREKFGRTIPREAAEKMIAYFKRDRELFKESCDALGEDDEPDFVPKPTAEVLADYREARRIEYQKRANEQKRVKRAREMNVQECIRYVSRRCGSSPDEVLSTARTTYIVNARWAVMAALRAKLMSYPEIGKALGVDHSSVIHGIRRFEEVATPEQRAIVARFNRENNQ